MSKRNSKPVINSGEASIISSSSVFVGHEDRQFALGLYSSNDIANYMQDPIPGAYLQLRANVYRNKGYLKSDVINIDGTEKDAYDGNSSHFIMLENLGFDRSEYNQSQEKIPKLLGSVAVFACMRIIEVRSDEDKLPVESFYPEIFQSKAPQKSIEVSRVIASHEEVQIRKFAQATLFTYGLAYALSNDLGPVYGVVEEKFAKGLKELGVPIKKISATKFVKAYNTENFALEIDKYEFSKIVGKRTLNGMIIPNDSFNYWGEISTDNSKREDENEITTG
jgi:N-acyl-L-homoserine lactone synthetase